MTTMRRPEPSRMAARKKIRKEARPDLVRGRGRDRLRGGVRVRVRDRGRVSRPWGACDAAHMRRTCTCGAHAVEVYTYL